ARVGPLVSVILSWAAALAESVTLPENGLRILANITSARARAGVIVRRDGGVTSYYVYPPYGGSSHDLGAALWPRDVEVIEDIAAAITSGEIWERLRRGLG